MNPNRLERAVAAHAALEAANEKFEAAGIAFAAAIAPDRWAHEGAAAGIALMASIKEIRAAITSEDLPRESRRRARETAARVDRVEATAKELMTGRRLPVQELG